MAKVALTATFPNVEKFRDYHDIPAHSDDLNRMFKETIRNSEVGFSTGGLYWGVFYVGRKPSNPTIHRLLFEAGFEISEDEDDTALIKAFEKLQN